jgi:hypothetical protein
MEYKNEDQLLVLIKDLSSKMDHIIASQNIILKQLQIPIVESPSDYVVIKPHEKNSYFFEHHGSKSF